MVQTRLQGDYVVLPIIIFAVWLHTKVTEPRPLRKEEHDLIVSLLSKAQVEAADTVNDADRVTDMADGRMGGIRFIRPDQRHFGKELARGEYLDSDGILVSVALNSDNHGDLFELDFWKVDFSPLKRYPRPEDLVLTG